MSKESISVYANGDGDGDGDGDGNGDGDGDGDGDGVGENEVIESYMSFCSGALAVPSYVFASYLITNIPFNILNMLWGRKIVAGLIDAFNGKRHTSSKVTKVE